MSKQYEKIEVTLGSTIDEAVAELLKYKEQGKLVYLKFNGVSLFSDIVTIDSAYLMITGKTREELITHRGSVLGEAKTKHHGRHRNDW